MKKIIFFALILFTAFTLIVNGKGTPGGGVSVCPEADKPADNDGYCVANYDLNGNLCPLADHLVELTIDGKGTIAGVGNGNPQSMEPFQSNQVKLFYGKAMLILRSTPDKGSIKVTASAKELNKAMTTITVE